MRHFPSTRTFLCAFFILLTFKDVCLGKETTQTTDKRNTRKNNSINNTYKSLLKPRAEAQTKQAVVVTKNYGNMTGDIMLSGFFPIHERSDNRKSDSVCGSIQMEDGILLLEAFYYALDDINARQIIPGVTLGAISLDSCSDERHSLEQAVDLLRALMTRAPESLLFSCADSSKPAVLPAVEDFHKVVGVVGSATSSVSMQLASLFSLFYVPQVSYLSTSPELSDTDRYPYFKRTVPSDFYQAKAMLEFLQFYNWTYVSVVYDNDNYGIAGYAEIETLAPQYHVCIAVARRLMYSDSTWGSYSCDKVINDLGPKRHSARAVILWTNDVRANCIFAAAARANASFFWIGSDGWSMRSTSTKNYEFIVDGAVTTQPASTKLPAFNEYLKNLSPHNNHRNPWFKEYWESYFKCKLEDDGSGSDLRPLCTGEESLKLSSGSNQLACIYVYNSVYAFAMTLQRAQRELCGLNYSGLCEALNPHNISQSVDLFEILGNVSFKDPSGQTFEFYKDTEGPPRYTYSTFRYSKYFSSVWVTAGSYSAVDGEEKLRFDPWFDQEMTMEKPSYCSLPCAKGQAKTSKSESACCWYCQDCSEYAITISTAASYDSICFTCPLGQLPNTHRNSCVIIPVTNMDYNDPLAVASLVFAAFGGILTLVVILAYLAYFSTPIIKASGRELSLYTLGGILFCFLSIVVVCSPPSDFVCGATRVVIGIDFVILYASSFAKLNRVSRVFGTESVNAKKMKYVGPRSQIIFVNLLVLMEVFVLASWLAASPPGTKYTYPERELNVLVCTQSDDITFLVALIYPLVLLILCTIYAFRTRKIPDGFNETRHIAFTSYTTCVIWLAFLPGYFLNSDNPELSMAIISFSICMNALVHLLVIFFPKLYICILRPEKNTRQAMMTRTSSIISSGSVLNNTEDGVGSVRSVRTPNRPSLTLPGKESGSPTSEKSVRSSIILSTKNLPPLDEHDEKRSDYGSGIDTQSSFVCDEVIGYDSTLYSATSQDDRAPRSSKRKVSFSLDDDDDEYRERQPSDVAQIYLDIVTEQQEEAHV